MFSVPAIVLIDIVANYVSSFLFLCVCIFWCHFWKIGLKLKLKSITIPVVVSTVGFVWFLTQLLVVVFVGVGAPGVLAFLSASRPAALLGGGAVSVCDDLLANVAEVGGAASSGGFSIVNAADCWPSEDLLLKMEGRIYMICSSWIS